MKFGQLIEYNMRNIFVKKPYTICAGETIPRLLSKKSISGLVVSNFKQFFLFHANLRAIEI